MEGVSRNTDAPLTRKLDFKSCLNLADQSGNTLKHIQLADIRGCRVRDIKSLKHIFKLIRSDSDQMKNLKGAQGTKPA